MFDGPNKNQNNQDQNQKGGEATKNVQDYEDTSTDDDTSMESDTELGEDTTIEE